MIGPPIHVLPGGLIDVNSTLKTDRVRTTTVLTDLSLTRVVEYLKRSRSGFSIKAMAPHHWVMYSVPVFKAILNHLQNVRVHCAMVRSRVNLGRDFVNTNTFVLFRIMPRSVNCHPSSIKQPQAYTMTPTCLIIGLPSRSSLAASSGHSMRTSVRMILKDFVT